MRLPDLVAYQAAVQHPSTAFADPQLRAASVSSGRLGLPRAVAGNFAVTYQLCNGARQWAVRCFHREAADRASRYAAISRALAGLRDGPLVPIEYMQDGVRVGAAWYPITKMPWIDGHPLNRAIESRLSTPAALLDLELRFTQLVNVLRRRGIAHGDLQHGNILVHHSGAVRLVDYDGMFVPALRGRSASESGDPNYQHPSRASQFDAELDRFAVLVIVLALRALAAEPKLWCTYNTGDNLLFQRADFADPRNSSLFRDLSAIPSVRDLGERLAAICRDDYAHIPLLDNFVTPNFTSQPPPQLVKPAHVVVLNRLYGPRPRAKSAPRSWKLRRSVVQHAIAFSADGTLLASGDDDGKITLRDAATGRSRRDLRLKRMRGSIRGLAITRGGGVVAAVLADGDVSVWEATAARQLQVFRGIRGLRTVALSAGGGWVAIGTSDGTLCCWSVANGRLLGACSTSARITAVAVSPDGRLVVSASSGGHVDLWRLPGGRRVGGMRMGKSVACLAFTPDGLNLAIATGSGEVSLWDVSSASTPSFMATLPGAFPLLRSLALSAAGPCLGGSGGDGSIWMRRLPVETTQLAPSSRGASHRLLDWLRRVALL